MAARIVPIFIGIDDGQTVTPQLDDAFNQLLRQALLAALHEIGMLSLPQFQNALRVLKLPEGGS